MLPRGRCVCADGSPQSFSRRSSTTTPGTWIHVKLAARIAGAWTKDYSLGVWADDTSTVRRHSVDGEDDANARVATDTLELTKAADALRISVVLFSANDATPSLRAVAAIVSKRGDAPLVSKGIPVAISVRYEAGELHNSPISRTDGHLIVVRGFAKSGDVVCNDPAFGTDETVEVTYDRDELTKVWQRSLGTTYLTWPSDRSLPIDPLGAYR